MPLGHFRRLPLNVFVCTLLNNHLRSSKVIKNKFQNYSFIQLFQTKPLHPLLTIQLTCTVLMLLKVELIYNKAGINLAMLALQIPVFLFFSTLSSEEVESQDSFYRKSKKGICTLAPFHAQTQKIVQTKTWKLLRFMPSVTTKLEGI